MDHLMLHGLINTDFRVRCPTRFYCFRCSSAVCPHCCGGEAHRHSHHGGQGVAPVEIERVADAPAIDAHRAKGCGYDLAEIQRVVANGRKWIVLVPGSYNDLRAGKMCLSCQSRTKIGTRWCSLGCRADSVEPGRFRQAALRLAGLAGAGQFGPPVQALDQFCTICVRSFSSHSCPDHVASHHAGVVDPEGSIIAVHHVDGWAAVPAGQLPTPFTLHVQAIELPDGGGIAFPVHRRVGRSRCRG